MCPRQCRHLATVRVLGSLLLVEWELTPTVLITGKLDGNLLIPWRPFELHHIV
jgi:hypothetical protein